MTHSNELKELKELFRSVIEILDKDKKYLEECSSDWRAYLGEIDDLFNDRSKLLSKIQSIRRRLDNIIQKNKNSTFRTLLDICTKTSKELDRMIDVSKKIIQNLYMDKLVYSTEDEQRLEDYLISCSSDIDNINQSIKDLLRKDLKKIQNKIHDSTYEEVRGVLYDAYEVSTELKKLSIKTIRFLENLIHAKKLSKSIRKSIPCKIAQVLKDVLELDKQTKFGGIRGIDIINAFSGIEGIHASTVIDKVRIYGTKPSIEDEENNYEEVPLDVLLYRYPPFVPLPILDKNGVRGSLVWFLLKKGRAWIPEDMFFEVKDKIYKSVDISHIPLTYRSREHLEKLLRVAPINVLKLPRGYIVVRIDGNTKKEHLLRIKYGSKKLKSLIDQNLSPEKIVEHYQKDMGKKRKLYDPMNLSYVWYCMSGYGLSTDPWDVECPFTEECERFNQYRKDAKRIGKKVNKCARWSWGRRIFPKVFPKVTRYVLPLKPRLSQKDLNFVDILAERGVYLLEKYYAIDFQLPVSGISRRIYFRNPLLRDFVSTNAIGIVLRRDIIRGFLKCVAGNPNEKSRKNLNEPKIKLTVLSQHNEEYIELSEILFSKYYIWRRTKGIRTFELFEKSSEQIIKDFNKFKEKEYDPSDYIDWLEEVLTHTLAHALLVFLSNKMEIPLEYLLYSIERNENSCIIWIIENSSLGSIDIISAFNEIYDGDPVKFMKNFAEEMLLEKNEKLGILVKHEKELDDYYKSVKSRFNSIISAQTSFNKKDWFIKKFIEFLASYLKKFLDNGLVLEHHYFGLHVALHLENGLIKEFINSLSLGSKEIPKTLMRDIKRYLDDIIGLIYGIYCLDGCTSCVVFERGCTEGLAQSLLISKYLLKQFLEFFFLKRKISLNGSCFLRYLLETFPQKRVIAISPYLDGEGVNLLKKLSEDRGIDVTLITKSDKANEFKDILKESKIKVRIWNEGHIKRYFIDDTLEIDTSKNLNLSSSKIDEFEIIWHTPNETNKEIRKYMRISHEWS